MAVSHLPQPNLDLRHSVVRCSLWQRTPLLITCRLVRQNSGNDQVRSVINESRIKTASELLGKFARGTNGEHTEEMEPTGRR